jgi:hypothetical protein
MLSWGPVSRVMRRTNASSASAIRSCMSFYIVSPPSCILLQIISKPKPAPVPKPLRPPMPPRPPMRPTHGDDDDDDARPTAAPTAAVRAVDLIALCSSSAFACGLACCRRVGLLYMQA